MSKMGSDGNIPETFKTFAERYSALRDAHEQIAKVVDQAGPLDRKCCELIKIGPERWRRLGNSHTKSCETRA